MDRHDFVLGSIALIAGVLLGLLFAPRGPSVEDMTSAIDARLTSVEGAASAAGDGVSALQTQMEEHVAALQTQVQDSVASLHGEFGTLGDRIGSVEDSIGSSAESMADRLSSEFSGRMESLGSAISESSSTMQSRLEGFREALDSGAGSSEAGASGGVGLGQSASLADGAVRAFVSRIDEENAVVRLAIHGTTSEVAVGESVDVTVDGRECTVTVDGIEDGLVSLTGICG